MKSPRNERTRANAMSFIFPFHRAQTKKLTKNVTKMSKKSKLNVVTLCILEITKTKEKINKP